MSGWNLHRQAKEPRLDAVKRQDFPSPGVRRCDGQLHRPRSMSADDDASGAREHRDLTRPHVGREAPVRDQDERRPRLARPGIDDAQRHVGRDGDAALRVDDRCGDGRTRDRQSERADPHGPVPGKARHRSRGKASHGRGRSSRLPASQCVDGGTISITRSTRRTVSGRCVTMIMPTPSVARRSVISYSRSRSSWSKASSRNRISGWR